MKPRSFAVLLGATAAVLFAAAEARAQVANVTFYNNTDRDVSIILLYGPEFDKIVLDANNKVPKMNRQPGSVVVSVPAPGAYQIVAVINGRNVVPTAFFNVEPTQIWTVCVENTQVTPKLQTTVPLKRVNTE